MHYSPFCMFVVVDENIENHYVAVMKIPGDNFVEEGKLQSHRFE